MPYMILSLLVVCRARLDEYRAVRNAVEEVLDVSLSTPFPSNGTHPFIFKRENNTDPSQKNIYKNRQSNDRATRLPSVWSWWPAWSTPTISHTSAVARSSIRFWYLCIVNKVAVEQMADQVAVESCLLEGQLRQALDWCELLAATVRKLARWIARLQKFLVVVFMRNLGTAKPTRNW